MQHIANRNPITLDIPMTPEEAFADYSARQWRESLLNPTCARSGVLYAGRSPITGDVYQPPARGLWGMIVYRLILGRDKP